MEMSRHPRNSLCYTESATHDLKRAMLGEPPHGSRVVSIYGAGEIEKVTTALVGPNVITFMLTKRPSTVVE